MINVNIDFKDVTLGDFIKELENHKEKYGSNIGIGVILRNKDTAWRIPVKSSVVTYKDQNNKIQNCISVGVSSISSELSDFVTLIGHKLC